MHQKHINKHADGQTHQRQLLRNNELKPRIPLQPVISLNLATTSTVNSNDDSSWADLDIPPYKLESYPNINDSKGTSFVCEDYPQLYLRDLWDPIKANRTFELRETPQVEDLPNDRHRFSLAPLTDELGLEMDEDSFGIECPGK
jgi:hypothetical protein